ncbi:MAG: glycosyltransferase family A protein [Candidatus Marinimicrobia bacterium]|nr:glycosyltransferase family A protein [Candidatus Neomarinimicrobiota bacterium]
MKTTIILHHNPKSSQTEKHYKETMESINNLFNDNYETVILSTDKNSAENLFSTDNVNILEYDEKNISAGINEAIKNSNGEYILYIDNIQNPVYLKQSSLDAFLLSAERNPNAGLFYTSYELKDGDEIKELNLLHHHLGRVRDNMDYGKVFFIPKKAIEKIGGFDESVKYNILYDLRLKISENYKIIRIANRYSGSFYQVESAGKKANVFDYLLAGKDVQLEAEKVVTEHLKRIGAYLEPNKYFPVKNKVKDISSLKASIIIPVGNRPEFIGTAIDSVLAQTVPEIEVIVMVNGGEDDPTADVVRKYMQGGEYFDSDKPEVRLFVLDINNIGLCLNLGAKNAKGKYYVQLDSDDQLKPDAVEKILKKYESSPEVGMVIGSYEMWEKLGNGKLKRMEEIGVVTHDEWTEENGRNNLMRINGAGAPRSIPITVIKEMGYFSINDDPYARNYGEDYEMVSKISEHYKIGRIFDPIYEVIRHSGGTDHAIDQNTIDRNDNAKDWVREEAIKRRQKLNS